MHISLAWDSSAPIHVSEKVPLKHTKYKTHQKTSKTVVGNSRRLIHHPFDSIYRGPPTLGSQCTTDKVSPLWDLKQQKSSKRATVYWVSPHESCPLLIILLESKYYHLYFIDTEVDAQICPRSPRSVCSFCFSSLPALCSLSLYLSLEGFQTSFI